MMPHYVVTLLTDAHDFVEGAAVAEVWAPNVDEAVLSALAFAALQHPDFVERCERAHVVTDDASSIMRDIPYATRLRFMPDGA
jgi:hypothetical protein